jgi:hypothetical protein
MRAAASLAWIGLLAFSVVSMLLSNYAWGMAGFCGILLQTEMNPSKLLFEILGEYAGRPMPIYQASQVEPSEGEIQEGILRLAPSRGSGSNGTESSIQAGNRAERRCP